MSKVLIVYASGTGCTAGIAERIGATLATAGSTVEVVAAKGAPGAAGYDAVLVGSGVRAGSWHKAAKEWVAGNADALKAGTLGAIPVAFFTACLSMADAEKADEARAYTDALIAETGVEPVDVGLFAGWNEPKEFPFVERTILKLMKAPTGDFRDWDAIDAWTTEVAGKLGITA